MRPVGHLRGNIVAYVALFVALGGTAFAATKIRSGDVVNNSLKSVDVRNDSSRGGGLKGADIRERTLEPTVRDSGAVTINDASGGGSTNRKLIREGSIALIGSCERSGDVLTARVEITSSEDDWSFSSDNGHVNFRRIAGQRFTFVASSSAGTDPAASAAVSYVASTPSGSSLAGQARAANNLTTSGCDFTATGIG